MYTPIMSSILLVSKSPEATETWLRKWCKDNAIGSHHIIPVMPQENGLVVDQIREVISVSTRTFSVNTAVVLYGFETAKELVQNTFLKTLEEHADNVHFVLVTSSIAAILPTIQSRCSIITINYQLVTSNDKKNTEMQKLINEIQKEKHPVLSARLKLKPSEKKMQAATFLTDFITYGSEMLRSDKIDRKWLAEKLKKAISAKQFIERNFVDPELAIDTVFLS